MELLVQQRSILAHLSVNLWLMQYQFQELERQTLLTHDPNCT